MRTATIKRATKETKIELEINLDGPIKGGNVIDTKIGFFDHMLDLFSFHSGFGLKVICDGDIEVDSHHTIEDVAIALGKAIKEALGNKLGVTRYGSFNIVMDEALVRCDLDLSGRSYLVFNASLPARTLGNYDVEMTEEFFRALSDNALITLHLNEVYGKNTHHIIEAMFKSTARALKQAVKIDETNPDLIVSSKGVL